MIGLVLLLVGIALIVINPIIGLIPGLLLMLIGVIALVFSGAGAVLRVGTTKVCPDCRSRIPHDASVCRFCGYRYERREP